MSLGTLLNPWGALRRLNKRYVDLCGELRIAERQIKELDKEAREARLKASLAKIHITKLEAELKEAHFRNPKTGRLGHKGERF